MKIVNKEKKDKNKRLSNVEKISTIGATFHIDISKSFPPVSYFTGLYSNFQIGLVLGERSFLHDFLGFVCLFCIPVID